jgi:hypothetical protein
VNPKIDSIDFLVENEIDVQIGDLLSSINNRTKILKESLIAKQKSLSQLPILADIEVDISRCDDDYLSENDTT